MEQIKVELCGGKMPQKAHGTDAAYDVFTSLDVAVQPYARIAVPLGFKIQLPKHLAVIIQPRSGMSLHGMPVVVCDGDKLREERIDADVNIGLVDSGYTGEVCALVRVGCGGFVASRIARSNGVYIPAGTKIAQMRIVEIPCTELVESVIDKVTERGDNGFNSTGVK